MDEVTSSGLVVPTGFGAASEGAGPLEEPGTFPPPEVMGRGMVFNETGLPDSVVMEATEAHFVASSGMAWGSPTNFQLASTRQQGSLLARSDFSVPTNVIDEMKLARDMAERDDDVSAVIREMIAIAFGEEPSLQHVHTDERSQAIFEAIGRNGDIERALKEMYREYLICSQFTTSTLFTREQLEFVPRGGEAAEESVASPVFGVFHSEDIRAIGNDMFGTAVLAYDPPNAELRRWLEEFFSDKTTPGRKAEMGRADRATANLFVGVYHTKMTDPPEERPTGFGHDTLFILNPRLCHRTSMPKGNNKYARPMLTANFALLEAKRLLNLMDYALLQGGSNFIVVAKKGTDERPAVAEEVENLKQVVRVASRSGVIVGDHRLSFEVITPELKELLNPEKRQLLGRKIAMRMLGLAERGEESGSETEQSEVEMISRVVTSDRGDIKRHIENRIYPEVVKRNRSLLKKGPAKIWFPKVVLQGLRFFTDLILKLRDRGDIARSTAVEAAGFEWDAEVAKRQAELARGDDQIMVPGEVPHSSPEAGPQDNNEGRPKGSEDGSKPDSAAPRRTLNRNPGETIKSWYDSETQEIVRVGEVTLALLEEYEDTKYVGRVTQLQRDAIEAGEPVIRGGVAVVPVNLGVPVHDELKAVTLDEGMTMVIGHRRADEAVIAVAIAFRDGRFSDTEVATRVARWGWGLPELPETIAVDPPPTPPTPPEPPAPVPPIEININQPDARHPRRRRETQAGDSRTVFDLSQLTPEQRTIIETAISNCRFDFTRLLPQMGWELGIAGIVVRFEDLSPGTLAEVPIRENEFEEESAEEILVSNAVTDEPERAAVAFLSEAAHLVDFFLLSIGDRRAITDAFPDIGTPEEDQWFGTASYWDQVGEAFMAAFVMAYTDYDPEQEGFSHQSTPEIAAKVKVIVDGAR